MTAWRSHALVILTWALLYLPATGVLPLLNRDEPRFARATIEMHERGDWIVPYFNGEYRFDKPPLTYWLMRGGYAVCGWNEAGARAHSVVCTLALALLVRFLGARWFSPRSGLLAALALLGCAQFLAHGRSATADLPLALCVAAALAALLELLGRPESPAGRAWRWVLWLSLALGFLAKGPVAWAVPGVTLLLFRFAFWRRPLPWSRLGFAWGLPLLLALAGAWGVPALLRTDGLFWSQGMHRHVVQRGLKAFDGRLFLPLVYYPATVLISLYPWSAWAGRAWVRTRRHWDLPAAFLAAWFLAPMLVFSFYATQLPHYVLPGFAAFLLLAFRGAPETEEYPRWTAVFGRAVALAPAAAACVVLLPAGWLALRGGPAWPLGLAGGAALAVAALAFWVRGGPDVPRRAVLAAALVGAALAACAALVRAQDPVVRMKEIFARLPPGARCIAWGFREPSLVYYSGRTWTFPRTVPDLAAALKQPGPQCVVLMRDETGLLRFLRRGPADRGAARPAWAGLDLRGYDRCEAEGLNTARGTWVRCDLLVRPPSPATRAAPE